MLDIKNAYLDFGRQLQPPPGYEIDYAVATTYSLDLYALLSIPLAMFYRQDLDNEVSEDNFQVLEAIQNIDRHLKIYCQQGKISFPKASSVSLLAFVEKCVIGIVPKNERQSFHPKVWVLRFKSLDEESDFYRVIVMSRNLTFDKSYDIAYWKDGFINSSSKQTNHDLINLLEDLNSQSKFEHKTFIKDLKQVKFDSCENFEDQGMTFFPTSDWRNKMGLESSAKKRLIISPFLSANIVDQFNQATKKKLIVFSRKNELDKLPESLINKIDPYHFEQEIVDHHLYENSDEGDEDHYTVNEWDNNLHAKIYIRENEEGIFWDLGSSNCSSSAFRENYEFMHHLKGLTYSTGINKVFNELTKPYNGVTVFKPYERSLDTLNEIDEPDYRKLEFVFFQCLLDSNLFSASIEKIDQHYDLVLNLSLPKEFEGISVKAQPVGTNQLKEVINSTELRFESIPLHKLSSFMHWKFSKGDEVQFSLVTKIEILNMPDYRLGNILKSLIDNPDKFMALIMSLLNHEPMLFSNLKDDVQLVSSNNQHKGLGLLSIPIYEDLLITLSRNPSQLLKLASIIDKLSEIDQTEIIPEEFVELWTSIKQLLPND